MQDSRRWAFGAMVIACALTMCASRAFGSAVCQRDHDESTAIVASDDARPCEWVAHILGEEHIAAKADCSPAPQVEEFDFPTHGEVVENAAAPRAAALIPLPPPVWSGMIGLSALVTGSALRKIRKLL